MLYNSAERHFVYDLETFPNCFTATFIHCTTGLTNVFEISDRRNDAQAFNNFIRMLAEQRYMLVGFNNIGFDYPVLHRMIEVYIATGMMTADVAYQKCQEIINSYGNFAPTVPPRDWIVQQIDLYKIYHFDNKAKSTSLKKLEFNMCSESVEDLPFPPGTWLTHEQMDTLLAYNFKDTSETLKFYWKSRDKIEFREKLTVKYGKYFLNHNDTKIGKDYFISKLEEAAPGICYPIGSREPRQTPRPLIRLQDVIFPYVRFEHPEFQRIHAFLMKQEITQTKGVFKDVVASINGFQFAFGLGGIHGSLLGKSFESNDEYAIIDIDVGGYYPSLSIRNKLHPAHLGELFCQLFEQMKKERAQYAKGTDENATLKLSQNGVYGDSGNPYSPFYDPQYTMTITVNGQLLLCMLAEQLIKVPTLQIIQINTDGVTVIVRRDQEHHVKMFCDWWQQFSGLELEEARYKQMFIRDVNNYIAVSEKGKFKRKGAYSHIRGQDITVGELAWHMDHSGIIIPKAAEAALVEGANIEQFIHGHRNLHDFMMLAKVKRGSVMQLQDGTPLPNTCRYYVSTAGQEGFKISPPVQGAKPGQYKRANGVPESFYNQVMAQIGEGVWDERIHTKNKSVYEDRTVSIIAGRKIKAANHMRDASFADIDYSYYVEEAKKLVAAVS